MKERFLSRLRQGHFSPGDVVDVLPHRGANERKTPLISAQFLEAHDGGHARVTVIGSGPDTLARNPDAFQISRGRGDVVIVPMSALVRQ